MDIRVDIRVDIRIDGYTGRYKDRCNSVIDRWTNNLQTS